MKLFLMFPLFGLLVLTSCTRLSQRLEEKSAVPDTSPAPIIPLHHASTNRFEIDFPFQTACISAQFPTGNIANKGIAIKLAGRSGFCFDPDLLRMSAAWTGGFVQFRGVTYDGSHGGHPRIQGAQQFGTEPGPGWADAQGSFADSRPEPFGPIEVKQGRWNGLYRVGDYLVLHYTVLGAEIHEQPSAISTNGQLAFVRTFQIGPRRQDLALLVCDSLSGTGRVEAGQVRFHNTDGTISRIGLNRMPAGARFEIRGQRSVVLHLPKGAATTFNLLLWRGEAKGEGEFAGLLQTQRGLVNYRKGGPPRWPETVNTNGLLAASTTPDGAYVTDQLSAPEKNPWNRRIRFGGMDFFKDGTRAALSTWDGDIWIVSGIDEKLENLKWKWFAAGGFENLGLEIVDDVIYTTGRDQITRYHDFNGDGEADYYENFNNQITSSPGFHEFVFDLQTDAQGNFYTAKAGPVRGGGSGFGGGGGNGSITAHAGTLMRISKDGKTRQVIATGFRAPNGIGVGPMGELTSGDNEGTWVPACPLNWIREGTFHGVEDLAHAAPIPAYQKPLMWFSKAHDNSGGGQVWVNSDRWGPFQNQLLHMSYGQSSIYLILTNTVAGQLQAGAVKIPVKFTSSAMRARFNPRDGQLYVAGLRGWQSNAGRETGFDRVRFTGKPVYTVAGLKMVKGGIDLSFTQPLESESAGNAESFSARQWNYQRTKNYGSPQFLPDSSEKGQETVEIKEATLSADGKTVRLQLSSFKPVHQLLIRYDLKAKDGTPIKQEILQTIHAVP